MPSRFTTIILTSILLALISIIVTYIIDNIVEIQWLNMQTFTNVITSISSLILLSIGILLYKKFNSSQLLVDKQTEKVVELLTFLNTLNFYCEVVEDGASVATYYNMHITDYKKRRKDLFSEGGNDYRKYVNYASPAVLDAVYQLGELASNPYSPKKIADRIDSRLNIIVGRFASRAEKSYLLVGVRGDFKLTKPTDKDGSSAKYEKFLDQFNKTDFVYEDLMFELEMVYQQCYEWIKANNATVFGTLNIRSVHEFNKQNDIY
jgi:hypothetical protein